MSDLAKRHCSNTPNIAPKLENSAALQLVTQVHQDWQIDIEKNCLIRTFEFKNYFETMAFSNAVAWLAQQQDHHPDMSIRYRHCEVCYTTHSVKGLSINDFICAARIDVLADSE